MNETGSKFRWTFDEAVKTSKPQALLWHNTGPLPGMYSLLILAAKINVNSKPTRGFSKTTGGFYKNFENPWVVFESPGVGFEKPMGGLQNSWVGFQNPWMGFESPGVVFKTHEWVLIFLTNS